jgi:hypothetical protein
MQLSKHLNENIGGDSPPDDRTAKGMWPPIIGNADPHRFYAIYLIILHCHKYG